MFKPVGGLRRWASGVPEHEAAVELLVCRFGGRYARACRPWVRPCPSPGWWWVDADALAVHAQHCSGDRRRVLMLAVELLGGPVAVVGEVAA